MIRLWAVSIGHWLHWLKFQWYVFELYPLAIDYIDFKSGDTSSNCIHWPLTTLTLDPVIRLCIIFQWPLPTLTSNPVTRLWTVSSDHWLHWLLLQWYAFVLYSSDHWLHWLLIRVGQSRMYAPYMTVYLVISLPKIPYIHRIYMVLANLTFNPVIRLWIVSSDLCGLSAEL